MEQPKSCSPGRRATCKLTVTEDDTALAMRSGDVRVLATPRVLALAEQAAVKSLEGCLPPGKTSVGSWVELEHLEPTPVGDTIEANAVLLGVHGRRLEFSIAVMCGSNEVAHIKHRRVVVSRSRFEPTGEPSTPAAS